MAHACHWERHRRSLEDSHMKWGRKDGHFSTLCLGKSATWTLIIQQASPSLSRMEADRKSEQSAPFNTSRHISWWRPLTSMFHSTDSHNMLKWCVHADARTHIQTLTCIQTDSIGFPTLQSAFTREKTNGSAPLCPLLHSAPHFPPHDVMEWFVCWRSWWGSSTNEAPIKQRYFNWRVYFINWVL